MKNERTRVCDLAGELHVSSLDLIQAAHALGINVIRATASLTTGQEYRLREWVANGHVRNRAARVPAQREAEARRMETDTRRGATCTCCGFTFLYVPLEESHEICSECRNHFEQSGEDFVRTLVRHEEHVAQAKAKVESYREKADSLAREKDEAYAKRNKWMAALVEVVVAHGPDEEGDGCSCGAPEYPCVTRRHLRHVNRGIYYRCEELEALNEDEFNRILYGHDYSFFEFAEDYPS
jgi:hypothetical protein